LKGKLRHDFIYRALWILSRHFIARKFNFKYKIIENLQSPYIVISNHVTNVDPILIGFSFGRCMYYVATDQLLRMGLKSRLLMYFFSPIVRAKTAQETQTVITIFRRLKDKCNICIFPEGMTSFNGEPYEIQPSISKLVKRAGVTLVTYRFTGGYFTYPRWARFIRKGKMEGNPVQIYSPEKIASMTEEEIYKAIIKDINVSAYGEQEKNPVVYRGKNRAEYLETVLYCCPKCRQFGTLTSCADILSCVCGFQVRFNELNYFEIPNSKDTPSPPPPPPLKTITDWCNWQRKEVERLAGTANGMDENVPIFTDTGQKLFEVQNYTKSTLVAEGKLCLYKNRLSLITCENRISEKSFDFPFETIIEMSCFAMMRILFSTNKNKVFEIHSKHPRSALKYADFLKIMKSVKE